MTHTEFTVDSFDATWLRNEANTVISEWKEVVLQHPECDMDQSIKALAISCLIYAWNNPQ